MRTYPRCPGSVAHAFATMTGINTRPRITAAAKTAQALRIITQLASFLIRQHATRSYHRSNSSQSAWAPYLPVATRTRALISLGVIHPSSTISTFTVQISISSLVALAEGSERKPRNRGRANQATLLKRNETAA
jgi:hypothetical protein